jgi:protein-disulfide isomerase
MSDSEGPRDAAMTIRIRRVHLWGLAGVVAGLLAGYLIGHATAPKSRTILYGVPPAARAKGSAAASAGSTAGAQSTTPKAPVEVSTAGRPSRGPADAKVTLVEFVDYQCPFCGQLERDTMPQIEKNYGDKIRIVSRQFPLSIHANAMRAALAMECAYQQGKFWPLHDRLFHHQDDLGEAGLAAQAQQSGLDVARLRTCEKSSRTKATIEKDIAAGRRYGVTGTPAVFINGRLVQGAQPYSQFKLALDAALKHP